MSLHHPRPLDSFGHVRAKLFGAELEASQFDDIVGNIVAGRYMDVHLAAFVAACSGQRLQRQEIASLTEAVVNCGEKLSWSRWIISDKHSVGGLPGNRTTPIVVAIAVAGGPTMPKTSSRAITSPAGGAMSLATELLDSGRAWDRFVAICEAQGGLREPPRANYRYEVTSPADGRVTGIDNRLAARIAKLAGAPADKAAGLEVPVRIGSVISRGEVLMVVHAESPGELEYSLEYFRAHRDVITLSNH